MFITLLELPYVVLYLKVRLWRRRPLKEINLFVDLVMYRKSINYSMNRVVLLLYNLLYDFRLMDALSEEPVVCHPFNSPCDKGQTCQYSAVFGGYLCCFVPESSKITNSTAITTSTSSNASKLSRLKGRVTAPKSTIITKKVNSNQNGNRGIPHSRMVKIERPKPKSKPILPENQRKVNREEETESDFTEIFEEK